jgi:hypothetical protein
VVVACARVLPGNLPAHLGQEGRYADQRLDPRLSACGVADDRTPVGVTDQDDRSGYLAHDRRDVFGASEQTAVGDRRSHHVQAPGDELRDDTGETGGIGEGVMNQNDGGVAELDTASSSGRRGRRVDALTA